MGVQKAYHTHTFAFLSTAFTLLTSRMFVHFAVSFGEHAAPNRLWFWFPAFLNPLRVISQSFVAACPVTDSITAEYVRSILWKSSFPVDRID